MKIHHLFCEQTVQLDTMLESFLQQVVKNAVNGFLWVLAQGFSTKLSSALRWAATTMETENCQSSSLLSWDNIALLAGMAVECLPAMQGHFATGSFLWNLKRKRGLQNEKAAGSRAWLLLSLQCFSKTRVPGGQLMSPPIWSRMCWEPEASYMLMVMILPVHQSAVLAVA